MVTRTDHICLSVGDLEAHQNVRTCPPKICRHGPQKGHQRALNSPERIERWLTEHVTCPCKLGQRVPGLIAFVVIAFDLIRNVHDDFGYPETAMHGRE